MAMSVSVSVSVSTQAKGLLLFLAVVSYAAGARGYTTWISNGASRAIVATTSYSPGTSKFIGRTINPGQSDKDEYATPRGIHVQLWVSGAVHYNGVDIPSDRSLVGLDHGGGTTGVDIYLAKDGTLFEKEGNVLVTIFLSSQHNSTGPGELISEA